MYVRAHTSLLLRAMNAIYVVVFAFCFAGAFAGLIERSGLQPSPNITKECLKEYGIEFDQPSDTPLTDEQLYCIPACAYRDFGIMKSDGTIDTEKAESYFGPNDAEERNIFFSVYKACYEGRTHCKLVQCMFNDLKNHWKTKSDASKFTRQLFSQLV